MTRKREIKRRLETLEEDTEPGRTGGLIVGENDPRTGDLTDRDGNSVAPTDCDVVFTHHIVMDREDAKREGREILGPAEETPPENDCVRVAPEQEWGGGGNS